jgi:endogenous inhibitor of DNA gyrase (YacG/DUF329 family)
MAVPFDNRSRNVRCPICKKEVKLDDPEMPFCSKRCRIIDLGNWADETYKISTPTYQSEVTESEEEESDEGQAR